MNMDSETKSDNEAQDQWTNVLILKEVKGFSRRMATIEGKYDRMPLSPSSSKEASSKANHGSDNRVDDDEQHFLQ